MKLHLHTARGIGMARPWPWLLGLMLVSTPALLAAQDTNRPVRLDYNAFRSIGDRNIFNASRSGGRPSVARDVRRPVRVDTITLVGTLESDQGCVAFFDGSSAEYRKALKPAARIAGFTVAAVNYRGVTLEANGKRLELSVGKALRREDEGEWRVTDGGLLASAGGSSSGSSTTFSRPESGGGDGRSGSGSPGPTPEANEILRRLMEQREREDR